MVWVLIVAVAVLLIAGFLALLSGLVPFERLSEPTHTTPALSLSETAAPDDVVDLRFDTAFRGYRMDQVDDALEILEQRLRALEADLDRCRSAE